MHYSACLSHMFVNTSFSLFQAAIWHCLNHYDYADAIFLAERLRAEGTVQLTHFSL